MLDTHRFDGADYVPSRDQKRLASQHERIKKFMSDGDWHTLAEISIATGAPEASVSAGLRDFRKKRFGSHEVQRQYIENGLFRYRVIFKK